MFVFVAPVFVIHIPGGCCFRALLCSVLFVGCFMARVPGFHPTNLWFPYDKTVVFFRFCCFYVFVCCACVCYLHTRRILFSGALLSSFASRVYHGKSAGISSHRPVVPLGQDYRFFFILLFSCVCLLRLCLLFTYPADFVSGRFVDQFCF